MVAMAAVLAPLESKAERAWEKLQNAQQKYASAVHALKKSKDALKAAEDALNKCLKKPRPVSPTYCPSPNYEE